MLDYEDAATEQDARDLEVEVFGAQVFEHIGGGEVQSHQPKFPVDDPAGRVLPEVEVVTVVYIAELLPLPGPDQERVSRRGTIATGRTGEPVAPTSLSGVHTNWKRWCPAAASSSSMRFSIM